MDRAAALLLGVGAGLWVDALAGGGLVGGPVALAAVAAAAFLVGLRCRLPSAVAVGCAAVALLAVADQVAEGARFSLASDGVFYAVVVAVPAALGRLLAVRRRELTQLSRRRADLQDRRDLLVRAARARERAEVERRVDLALRQRLRTVVDSVDRATEATDPRPALRAAEEAARAALAELREVLSVLHDGGGAAPPVAPGAPSAAPRASRRLSLLLVLTCVPLAVETAAHDAGGVPALDVVLALAQGGALALTARRPLPGAALLVVLATAQTALLAPLPQTVSWLLPGLVAALLLGRLPALGTAALGLLVLSAGSVLMVAVQPAGTRGSGGLLPGLVMGLVVWTAARQLAARDRRLGELRAIADELDRTADSAAGVAADEQRLELARELHDVGAHALTVVCLQAGAAQAWWGRDGGQVATALRSLREVAHGGLTDLTTSLGALDAAAADDSLPRLLEALPGLGRALDLHVVLDVQGPVSAVPADVGAVARRVVQEALTNAARHAAGTDVLVRLEVGADTVLVEVHDTGRLPSDSASRLPAAGAGRGLRGLADRVGRAHGSFSAGPVGDGFAVSARLPT